MTLAYLELDLDVFSGPFDLLLTLILREEVDLLEIDLAQVVVAYIDHLQGRGELDLEAATEFLVLIAALLELKSRLLLGSEQPQELELEPEQAADELLLRLLDCHRFRGAGAHLARRLEREGAHRFRQAPLPATLRRAPLSQATAAYRPAALSRAIAGLLREPPTIDVRHVTIARVSVAERLAHLRRLLARGRFTFSEAVARADRVTVAVTLYALLELHKQGEATWVQEEPFAEIHVHALAGAPAAAGETVRSAA
ncbi:MAG TPA: segregation/condensation protein A [Solirubrobacteraceae bacterium]|nr:segregation/condensation protein A [Solirubrobacteraceae bacterium]